MFRVHQHCEHPRVPDVAVAVRDEMAKLQLEETIKPGEKVAITAGSRGIADLTLIIKSVVHHLKGIGAIPFVVPAMGSHGGGTAEGQLAILKTSGVTPDEIGCGIRSSMNTVYVDMTEEGIAVYFDQEAYRADHVIVCNRIKTHTGYTGVIESGLMKMMVIGLGNYTGARTCHRAFQKHGFDRVIRSVGRTILFKCPITAGLAIVENGCGEIAVVEGVRPDQFEEREEQLLVKSKQWLLRLPFSEMDLLIVEEMGKNISGAGMDPNVTGPRPHRGSRTLGRKIFGALSRIGKAYWDHVLRRAPSEEHRLITHWEFFDTFVRMALRYCVGYSRLGCRSLGLDKRVLMRQSDESYRFVSASGLPQIRQVFVRGLTNESQGNAVGVGRADLCTTRLLKQVDWRATFLNYLAVGSVLLPAVPRHYATDHEVLDAILATADQDAEKLRVIRIQNTLQLRELELSGVYRAEAKGRQDLTVLGPDQEMGFDDKGNLLPL